VILLGDAFTFALLHAVDPDFQRLFKVKAQFADETRRTSEAVGAYAAFVSAQCSAHTLLPFRADGVARIVEFGARLTAHQDRLATRFETLGDALVWADQAARAAGVSEIGAAEVDAALAAHERRVNLVEERVQREIEEGTLAIDTHSEVAGQVNGLSVLDLGDYAFARPSKITARAGLGEEGVVDIEREVKLSGPTHSKGILILSGYLLGQYAQTSPLALSARLTFEQVYGEVDGDSASSAELYALLSALSGVPIRQGIAVTGSVNQLGDVQAVGGVTTKIEGFFAVCRAQGLDGRQGVIIPAANVRHLMLKEEVVDAVRAGLFHVWAVRTIDEGIELLTGVGAGARNADGSFPPGSVHGLVQHRLIQLAERLIQFRRRMPSRTRRRAPAAQTHNGRAGAQHGDVATCR
jgi:predicted ATP-dependent protease